MIFFQFYSIMILLLGVIAILILEYLNINKFHAYITILALLGSLLVAVSFIVDGSNPQFFGLTAKGATLNYLNSLLVFDQFTAFFAVLFTGIIILVVLSAMTDLENVNPENRFVYYVLMLFVTVGMILVSSAVDLAALVVSWELVSIPSYMLVAFVKRDKSTSEAAIKYFIIGSISSALMLFGSSFLYGISGSTNVYVIMNTITSLTTSSPLLKTNQVLYMTPIIIIGLILVIAGLGFKMGIVPFHWWLPDAYEGSMTSVTAMLAAASKKVGFAAGFRIIMIPLLEYGAAWNANNLNAQESLYVILLLIAIITMIYGNIVALSQTRMKRLLAYSSIGQAGYILLALASAVLNSSNNSLGLVGGLFHSASHAIMTVGAFICVIAITRVVNSDEIEDYRGIRKQLPKTSFALGLCLLGLAGIPPLIGFFSKFFIFFAAIEAAQNIPSNFGAIGGLFYLGAIVGILTSAISVYYYVKVVKIMWVDDTTVEPTTTDTKVPWNISLPIFVSVAIILLISVAAGPLIDYLTWVAGSTLNPSNYQAIINVAHIFF